MKKNPRNAGRNRLVHYESIFGDYDDTDLSKKKLKIPKIVRHDIGWELITGMKHTSEAYEHTYMKNKKTPLRREHRYYEKQK